MCQAEGGINGTVIVLGSKLVGQKDVERVHIQEHTFSNNFLKELSTTFQETDGLIGFGKSVVRFQGLQNDDNKGIGLGVMSQ